MLDYFLSAKHAHLKPTLLEFSTDSGDLDICGISPSKILEVRNGRLFIDGRHQGPALDIFDQLRLQSSKNFFPCFIGYFSYEFAQYFSHETKPPGPFPDAFFCLYEQGRVVKNGKIIEDFPLDEIFHKPNLSPQTLTPLINEFEFYKNVGLIKDEIRAGNNYQVNFSLPFKFEASAENLYAIYQQMREFNQSPFMGILEHDDWQILSLSPERLFSVKDGELKTRPIAGTKKRSLDPAQDEKELKALRSCPKENAEHAMLVDLMRNDLNQVAKPGTVMVSEDRTVEFYSHVMHLVSEVKCQTSTSLKDIFKSLFPGGTITGAPKSAVMKTIAKLESYPRGPYTGSLGYISGQGVDFNILIRSIFRHKNHAFINAGAGIVIDSIPENEWQEVHKKAQAIGDILAKKSPPKAKRAAILGPCMLPQKLKKPLNARVWFLENNDSFSFNIIDALKSLGCKVHIARLGDDVADCSHVILGPGPGNPKNMPEVSAVIKKCVEKNIPLLGICLGHQAIGHYFGGDIVRLSTPVHGQAHLIEHKAEGLFTDLVSPSIFARYHSLVVDRVPNNFIADAESDGAIMALRHEALPIYGLQFHPESYLSKDGVKILENFLKGKA